MSSYLVRYKKIFDKRQRLIGFFSTNSIFELYDLIYEFDQPEKFEVALSDSGFSVFLKKDQTFFLDEKNSKKILQGADENNWIDFDLIYNYVLDSEHEYLTSDNLKRVGSLFKVGQ
jgi:hypothetical protein